MRLYQGTALDRFEEVDSDATMLEKACYFLGGMFCMGLIILGLI